MTQNTAEKIRSEQDFDAYLRSFHLTQDTEIAETETSGVHVTKYLNEFWTAKQRDANRLHEVSYRACFKPQLPRFFIDALTLTGDRVYDPFGGRGTTVVEAVLAKRCGISNDINPLSRIFAEPRTAPPFAAAVAERLNAIPLDTTKTADIDLSMFYHPATLGEIVSLKEYLRARRKTGTEDAIDNWIRMVATNRLTGHSSGFFSVYTLPPNQAVSPERQKIINEKRNQTPPCRDVKNIILKKSNQLMKNVSAEEREAIAEYGRSAKFITADARNTPDIADCSVQLTVTSPPFLNIVQYGSDNWLRCWFNDIDSASVAKKITMPGTVKQWSAVMAGVFHELFRITKCGGWVAFEVGEVRRKTVSLDEAVVPLGVAAGFELFGVLVNRQKFTKTANIWGVANNEGGTNSNRVVLFRKR